MSEPTEPTPPAGVNRTAIAIAAFFAILLAFNVAFYVVALTHPVVVLPAAATSAGPANAAPPSP